MSDPRDETPAVGGEKEQECVFCEIEDTRLVAMDEEGGSEDGPPAPAAAERGRTQLVERIRRSRSRLVDVAGRLRGAEPAEGEAPSPLAGAAAELVLLLLGGASAPKKKRKTAAKARKSAGGA